MYHFIINPNSKSRASRRLWRQLENELKRRGIQYRIYFTRYAGHASAIAAGLCARHGQTPTPLIIVTAGGDGTVNEVINGIPDSCAGRVLLGFLPVGSGNDFAAALGIPADPLKALRHILSPRHTASIDVGVLSCPEESYVRRFGVSSGIGYDADVCRAVSCSPAKTVLNRLHLGRLSYLALALKLVFTHRPIPARLIFDGVERQSGSYLFIAAMNASHEGGGLRLAPGAKMNDRRLSVCVVRDFPRLKILLLLPALLFGLHTRFSGIEVIDCTSLEIQCRENATLHTDGEFAGRRKHIRYSCADKKLRVIL